MDQMVRDQLRSLESKVERKPLHVYILACQHIKQVFEADSDQNRTFLADESLSPEKRSFFLACLDGWRGKFLAIKNRALKLMTKEQAQDAGFYLDYKRQQERLDGCIRQLAELEKEFGRPVTSEGLAGQKEQNRAKYNAIGRKAFDDWTVE
ncbi:MAG: hypothetical protein ACLQAH_13530 [Limisphaerales bacterium]